MNKRKIKKEVIKMNKKSIKERTVYEFDVDSFEKDQAYKINIQRTGATYIGLLVSVDKTTLSFVVAGGYGYVGSPVRACGSNHGILNIDINEYMKDNISILKLGVVESNE